MKFIQLKKGKYKAIVEKSGWDKLTKKEQKRLMDKAKALVE